MNLDDEKIEPSTDLSLALGYSDQCIQRILNNDPGAGANAASTLDMTFVATNPLSELVWSPHKGLSLRCADGTFIDKKPSLSWGLGPTNMSSRSSSDIPIATADKATMDNGICVSSLRTGNLASEVARGENTTTCPISNEVILPLNETNLELKTAIDDQVEGKGSAVDCYFLLKEDERTDKGKGESNKEMGQIYPTCVTPIVRDTNASDGNHTLGLEIVLTSEFHTLKENEALNTKIRNATSFGKGHDESPSAIEKDIKNKKAINPLGAVPLEKLESTDENDLETPFGYNAFDVMTKTLASESNVRDENNTQQGDEMHPSNKTLVFEQSPTSGRLQIIQTKGKSKALSDGDANERMLDEDRSHESVESCNSARHFSTGKRPCNFDQQQIVGRKRVKRQNQDGPNSFSAVKQDSSFVSWISNMMKGFLNARGEEPFHSPTLVNPNSGDQNLDQNIFTSNRKKDPACKTIGFQSIFQSLYCGKTKGQEVVILNADHQTEGSKECERDDKTHGLNATPVACSMVTGNVYERFLPSKERFDESTSGNQVGTTVTSRDVSMSFPSIQENRSNSTENKNSCNLATNKEKDGTSSNSSQSKHKMNSVGKIDSELLSEEKTARSFNYKGDPSESLWITRFTPKACPSLNKYPSTRSSGEALDCSADGTALKPLLQNPFGSSKELESIKIQKQNTEDPFLVQNHSSANEFSFGVYKVKGVDDDESTYKLNPILPSPRVRTAEAMASVFAKRLDALKHIAPSDDPDISPLSSIPCFFCGKKGHHLQECPDVTDNEFEDLMRNINLYEGIKKMPCVCVRCFQHDHWAVACPSTCSRIRDQAESNSCLGNQCCPRKMQPNVRNEDDIVMKDFAAKTPTVGYRKDSGMEKDLDNSKANEATTLEKMRLNVNLFEKEIASSSGGKGSKEKQIIPLYGFINGLIADIPKGVFDAVRSLRLTRTNILKWMNSIAPLSPLDGYFLRLRLGKWEEGLGGTGYYVARITGMQMESSSKFKKSIAVNVGGVKCVVESQYVSNHDFLEDELRAWWSATSRSGGKLPSEEELRIKLTEKKTLGL